MELDCVQNRETIFGPLINPDANAVLPGGGLRGGPKIVSTLLTRSSRLISRQGAQQCGVSLKHFGVSVPFEAGTPFLPAPPMVWAYLGYLSPKGALLFNLRPNTLPQSRLCLHWRELQVPRPMTRWSTAFRKLGRLQPSTLIQVINLCSSPPTRFLRLPHSVSNSLTLQQCGALY